MTEGVRTIDVEPDSTASTFSPREDGGLGALILRAREGDREAIGTLLDRYRTYLREVARRRMTAPLARRLDASDLVQDALLEAHGEMDALLAGDELHLRACLRQILCCNIANAIRDHLHAAKRDAGREAPLNTELNLAEDITSPSMQAHRRDLVERFLDILDAMPEDEATAIRLRYFDKASVSEIAESLGRSRGAAASLLKRGLGRIRGIFQQDRSAWT